MLLIENGAILITRGDCGTIALELSIADGEPYEIMPTDVLELTVREKPTSDSPVLIHVQGNPGEASITLHSEDTQISPGQYSADIQLAAGDCRYTVWPEITAKSYNTGKNWKNFIVGAEVTEG